MIENAARAALIGAFLAIASWFGAAPASAQNQVQIFCLNASNNWVPCSVTPTGPAVAGNSTPVVQAFSASTTLQSGATANGNGTAMAVNAYAGAVLHVVCSVACSGGTTINFEASFDNTTYVSIYATPLAASVPTATATTTGDFSFNVSGYSYIRARISSYSAGTITVTGYAAANPSVQPGTGLNVPVPSSASGNALSHASVTSLGNSLVVKTTPGNLYGFNCTAITGGVAGFCVAYNGTSSPGSPTAADVLDVCYFGTTAAGCSLSRIPMGVNYSNGIVIYMTTAATPFTNTTGTDIGYISADYD